MTADARPFTEAIEGTGPAELDYRGPQGWATVVHRARHKFFSLLGPDGSQLAYDVGFGEYPTRGLRTWEYRVGLSGPHRLRIVHAERWSISVTPLEQDEVEDGGYFSYRGIGCQTVEFVKTDPEYKAIIEFTKVVCPSRTRQDLNLVLADRGVVERWDVGDTDRIRFEYMWDIGDAHHDGCPGGRVTGRVEVRAADNHEWRLRVLPLSAAEPLETRATGTGSEVLVYAGPPGAVTLRYTGDRGFAHVAGFGVSLRAYGDRPFAGGDIIGIVVPSVPTLLQVRVAVGGGWELHITPLDEVPTFDRQISGRTGKVVRYTGPPATAEVISRPWYRRYDVVSVRTFTADLNPEEREWVFAKSGPLARLRRPRLELHPGMLVAIAHYSCGWRIRAKTRAV